MVQMLTYHHARKPRYVSRLKKKKSTAKEEYLYHMLDTPETDIRTFNIQVINQFTSENF